jgi:hypothetical protein
MPAQLFAERLKKHSEGKAEHWPVADQQAGDGPEYHPPGIGEPSPHRLPPRALTLSSYCRVLLLERRADSIDYITELEGKPVASGLDQAARYRALEVAPLCRPARGPADIRDLIRTISRDNPLWGAQVFTASC